MADVKVGQVWRHKVYGVVKITQFDDTKVVCVTSDEKRIVKDCYACNILKFAEDAELVTMDNIKPGEWVECIKNCSVGLGYTKGEKYKIGLINNPISIGIINGGNPHEWHFANTKSTLEHFKPCLPPQEDTMKTYSNAEIMQLLKDGKFIEGDKIHTDNNLTLEIVTSHSGTRLGFKSKHKGQIVFAKGDRWTIEYAYKWEECTAQEAVELFVEGECDIKVEAYSNGQNAKVVYELEKVELPFIVSSYFISKGSWYKKVTR